MKYICLKCKKTRSKKIGEKTYKKKLPNGKIIKVPVCCERKMELME